MSLRPEERRRRDIPDKVLAFYIRLSSEDRDLKTNALKNESNSVFNQRRLLQDYYDTHESLHGYEVIVFCDDGVTGTHFDRPKFDELIEMARNQEIHCIMVKDLSRFGRNFLEMGNYLELILPLYGVRFISINDAFDSDDYLGVTGGLELALRNLINNMYSRDLSTKVRSAFRTRNLRGEYWGGNGFYGYQVHPHNKKSLIVDEQVRDIIVMIFESCVAGMTTSEVAQMLNDMGIPSPLEHKRRNGGFYNGVVKEETGIWLKGAVRKILTDERYTGKMITNTRETEEVGKPKMRSLPRDQWIIVPGTHEAIISEELFRAAQNALQGRIRNVNKNTAGNENSSSPAKQPELDSSNSGSASSGQSSSSTGTQPTATSTPKPTENVSSGSSNTATATSTPVPTATPTPVPTATPTPEPTATPTPKPVWGWKNAKGTIKTTYDSAANGSNIPIEIPNMPVSGETCDGKLTGYGKVTDATEEAVWNYLDNKFGEDFCGVGHLKVVDGSVH